MNPLNTDNYDNNDNNYNNDKDKYKHENSSVLDLEMLNMKYKVLLFSYKQAVDNYVNYLREQTLSQDNNKINKNFSWIKGVSYWGTNSIEVNNSPTLQECSASCAKTSGCAGATFNKDDYEQPMCWLRSGEGNVVASVENDYAIIPKGERLLKIIEYINLELTNINEKIQEIIKTGKDIYNYQIQERKSKSLELLEQYKLLMSERDKITDIKDAYKTLHEKENNQNIMITQNYYSYILLFFLSIVFIFILYKSSLQENNQPKININRTNNANSINPFYIIFAVIIIIIIIHFYNKYFNI